MNLAKIYFHHALAEISLARLKAQARRGRDAHMLEEVCCAQNQRRLLLSLQLNGLMPDKPIKTLGSIRNAEVYLLGKYEKAARIGIGEYKARRESCATPINEPTIVRLKHTHQPAQAYLLNGEKVSFGSVRTLLYISRTVTVDGATWTREPCDDTQLFTDVLRMAGGTEPDSIVGWKKFERAPVTA